MPSPLPVLRLTALVGTVCAAAVYSAAPEIVRHPLAEADMVLLVLLWLGTTLRFSDIFRVAIIEIVYFGIAANAVMIAGMTPAVPVLLALFILLATIYYQARGCALAAISSLLLIAAGSWGWAADVLPIGVRPGPPAPSHVFWTPAMIVQALGVCGIVGIFSYIAQASRSVVDRLRLAEGKFTKAFRICPDAMVISELETGRFVEVNESHEKLTGYRREEVLGRTSLEIGTFVDEKDRAEFVKTVSGSVPARQIERQIRDRAGRPIDVSYSAECFDFGGQKCVVVIIQDISKYKRTEAALIANEDRFRSFIENAGVGIYRSTPNGRIVMANRALIGIMGYNSLEELKARNLENEGYEPSYPRQQFKERIERTGRLIGWEAAWKRRDGTTIHVRESANVIRGADGSIQYYDGIIEDISERKQAEKALLESEERFRHLTAAAFEGIMISEDGRIKDVNDQALRLLGYERSEVIGREIVEFVSPETREFVAENIRTQCESAYKHQMVRKDGSLFDAEAQAKRMQAGERSLTITAIRDISDRLQNEQKQKYLEEQLRQMQKMEALGTLAGGIAHDFNNILTGILGNVQLAEMDLEAGHPALPSLEASAQACRRARDLVARILSFSRLEHDNRTPGPLGPTVLEAVALLRVGLPGNIEVRTEVDDACPSVMFDSSQIHQVILNLGTNSIHALKEHGGTVAVELRSVEPSVALMVRHPQVTRSHTVRLTLRDNGCGMSPSVLKRVFEPFYTTKANGKGTGLGLAMVHAIVTAHQGAIVIDSAPGSGTAFNLYFPGAGDAAPGAAPQARALHPGDLSSFGNGRKILLVDDQETVRHTGSELLRRLGFSPMAFERPADALAAFGAAPSEIAAVISDLTMPEMTGLELAQQIIAIRPDTPVIIASGYLPSETEQKARALGVRCVVSKPFELRELTVRIRAVLDAHCLPAG